jgi:hypothetical protein
MARLVLKAKQLAAEAAVAEQEVADLTRHGLAALSEGVAWEA